MARGNGNLVSIEVIAVFSEGDFSRHSQLKTRLLEIFSESAAMNETETPKPPIKILRCAQVISIHFIPESSRTPHEVLPLLNW
jgi:hypothetical protein